MKSCGEGLCQEMWFGLGTRKGCVSEEKISGEIKRKDNCEQRLKRSAYLVNMFVSIDKINR